MKSLAFTLKIVWMVKIIAVILFSEELLAQELYLRCIENMAEIYKR